MVLQLKKALIPPHPLNFENFEKSIMKMILDLMVFILEIICLKQYKMVYGSSIKKKSSNSTTSFKF